MCASLEGVASKVPTLLSKVTMVALSATAPIRPVCYQNEEQKETRTATWPLRGTRKSQVTVMDLHE